MAWYGFICIVVFAGMLTLPAARADDASQPSLSRILDDHLRRTFADVSAYVRNHPRADDAEAAYRWLLETAWEQGLEGEAAEIATDVLRREETPESLRGLARRVRGLGLARAGELEEALKLFDEHLQSVRLRSPDETLDFAHRLAAQAQLADSAEGARAVYERLSTAFFLNPDVRRIAEARLERLGLVGRQAPEVTVDDLTGTRVDLSDFDGNVLLVDFWATNCPPCLKEFPDLKRLYAEHEAKGLTVLGVSLDEDAETVRTFQEQAQLPWRLALSGTDRDATRGRYRVPLIPATILVGRDGRVAYVDLRGRDLERGVRALLGTGE